MINIRRSKINSITELASLKNLRNLHPEMDKSLSWLMKHIDELIAVRKGILINEDFTSEEFKNTKNYVHALLSERYEDLVDYIIDEDN